MRPRCLFMGLVLFFTRPAAHAADLCSINSAQDVLSCALQRHPDILRAAAGVRSAQALERAAKQRPNPEADAQTTSFGENAEPALKVEANLVHTFELGGKRSSRIAEARSRLNLAEVALQTAQEQVALQTVMRLYRLRQLGVEIQTLDEGIHTFGTVVQAFRSRAARSAEQEVSLNVFGLAQSEQALRKSTLLQERAVLQAYFESATGAAFEKVAAVLPPERREWPDLLMSSDSEKTAARREAEGALQLSQTELAAASGDAWPDLKLGPRLESNSGHGQNSQGYGVALALPLPLYQRNEGGKRLAQSQLEEAELALAQRREALETERRKWSLVYSQAIAAYREGPSLDEIQKKHDSFETSFKRGLVPATLVIEAHRQLAEYVKSRHEQELRALEALWSNYTLAGTILKERL